MTESSAPEVVEETVTATQSSNHQSAPPTEQKRVKLTTVSLVACNQWLSDHHVHNKPMKCLFAKEKMLCYCAVRDQQSKVVVNNWMLCL